MENGINQPSKGDLQNPSDKVSFSETELAIIRLICEEKTTEEIARRLNLSKRSVVSHRQKLLIKTGSRSSIGILTYAVAHGIYTDI